MSNKSRFIVASYSKGLYYILNFASFGIAVYFMEQIRNKLTQYITNEILLFGGTYVVAYILAIFIIPTILFWIAAQMVDN